MRDKVSVSIRNKPGAQAADDVRVIPLDDRERWEVEHRAGGLPSQSWAYAQALAASGIEAQLAVVSARGVRMLMPFFERRFRGHVDIATTPGLSGASLSAPSTAPLALWAEYARDQRWVAGYVQLAFDAALTSVSDGDELVTSNEVFTLDLRRGDPLPRAARTVRYKVRAAEQSVGVCHDRAALADALVRLYPETMRRAGAENHRPYADETIARWALDPTSVVVGAQTAAGIEAVIVACRSGNTAELHILGTTAAGRNLSAWLYVKAAHRLRELGVDTLNLGGGVRPGDGLARFKAWFHGARWPLRAVRQVYDRALYERLCRDTGASSAQSWFPAYSDPRAHAGRQTRTCFFDSAVKGDRSRSP